MAICCKWAVQVEESARGQNSVNAGMPLFLAVVMTLLMIQLKSISRAFIVFLTAPLGIIGVVLFLLIFNKPFGFVAMLGTIALSGMIMRNSLILIDQIEQDIQAGESAVGCHHQCHSTPLSSDRLDRTGCCSGHDSLVPQYFFRADGSGHYGWFNCGDILDPVFPACTICTVV